MGGARQIAVKIPIQRLNFYRENSVYSILRIMIKLPLLVKKKNTSTLKK